MTDNRPVLLGMNNPLSGDPRHALAPYPSNSSGHRLWRMLNEINGCSRSEYMRAFDRRNALDARRWDFNEARRQCAGLLESIRGRELAVLGRELLVALGLNGVIRPLEWSEDLVTGVRWCHIPHPSGLNLWYNDELNRHSVGLRLESMLSRSRSA